MRAAAVSLALLAGAAASAGALAAEPCAGGACFAEPVARYGHAVLGDTPEWARLTLGALSVTLPEDRVFEDLAPRVIDWNGRTAVVVVESGAREGAQLAIYAEEGGRLAKVAATPPIGTRFRWLAPVAVADLDGDGTLEVAYVDRPHLAGLLRVWRLTPEGLVEAATPEAGFSNHRIGDAFIVSALSTCGGAVELIVPDFGWTGLRAVRLEGGALRWRDVAGEVTPEGVARAAACG